MHVETTSTGKGAVSVLTYRPASWKRNPAVTSIPPPRAGGSPYAFTHACMYACETPRHVPTTQPNPHNQPTNRPTQHTPNTQGKCCMLCPGPIPPGGCWQPTYIDTYITPEPLCEACESHAGPVTTYHTKTTNAPDDRKLTVSARNLPFTQHDRPETHWCAATDAGTSRKASCCVCR
jgi:hypothetical protein